MLYWMFVCFAIAIVMLTLELFLPSAGLFGVMTVALVIGGIVCAFLHNMVFGTVVLVAVVASTPFLLMAAVRIWPHTPIGRRILINDRNDVMPKGEHYDGIVQQAGKVGVAATKMYPSGVVRIGDQKFNAVSTGFPIDEGQRVRVVSISGNRLHVQAIGDDEDDAQVKSTDAGPDSGDQLSKTMEDLGIEDFELGGSEEEK